MNIPSEMSTQNALLQNNLSGYYNNRSYAEQMAQQKLEYSGIGEAIASSLIAKSNLGNISITGDDLMSVGRSLVPDFSNLIYLHFLHCHQCYPSQKLYNLLLLRGQFRKAQRMKSYRVLIVLRPMSAPILMIRVPI